MMEHPIAASLEQRIAEQIRQLYRTQLGQMPDQVICQLFRNKIMILIEGGLTAPELLLLDQHHTPLVQQVRDCLQQILRPKVKSIIEQTSGISLTDLLTAVHLETNRISLVAILDESLSSDELDYHSIESSS